MKYYILYIIYYNIQPKFANLNKLSYITAWNL